MLTPRPRVRRQEPRPTAVRLGPSHLQKPQTQSGWLRRALAAATAADPDFPAISIHDLCHAVASLAISAGATPKAVERILGHASAAMTLDVYADLFEDDAGAVASALDEARARATVGDPWGKRF